MHRGGGGGGALGRALWQRPLGSVRGRGRGRLRGAVRGARCLLTRLVVSCRPVSLLSAACSRHDGEWQLRAGTPFAGVVSSDGPVRRGAGGWAAGRRAVTLRRGCGQRGRGCPWPGGGSGIAFLPWGPNGGR